MGTKKKDDNDDEKEVVKNRVLDGPSKIKDYILEYESKNNK